MYGIQKTRHCCSAFVLILLVSSPVCAQTPTLVIDVASELQPVFSALADAFEHDISVREHGGEPDLRLAQGTVSWRDVNSVAVTDEAVLTLLRETPESKAFLRFAASKAAQQSLIDAGELPASVTVTDQRGRSVDIPQPAERIFSPYSLTTYMLYVLGAGDRIMFANYLGARDPAGAAAMERIDPKFPERSIETPQETTNVEFVASITPGLVTAPADASWSDSVERIGVPLLGLRPESGRKIVEAMRILGRALGPDATARAEAWSAYYDHVLDTIQDHTRSRQQQETRPRVLFTGSNRTRVASGDMYQSALIAAAGGRSVTEHLRGTWNDVDVEHVLQWDPDLILVAPYGQASVEAILDDPQWQLLDAVRSEDVLRVPKLVAPWDTPVPDSVLGVIWLAENLHGAATGLQCGAEAAFFYRRFYDYTLSDDELTTLCK